MNTTMSNSLDPDEALDFVGPEQSPKLSAFKLSARKSGHQ